MMSFEDLQRDAEQDVRDGRERLEALPALSERITAAQSRYVEAQQRRDYGVAQMFAERITQLRDVYEAQKTLGQQMIAGGQKTLAEIQRQKDSAA